jgi:hypothetical protein
MSKANQTKVNPYIKAGTVLALAFINADKSSEGIKREAILTASLLATDKEKADSLLTAYAEAMTKAGYTDSVVRVRKSECNAVFKALQMTEVSEHNYKLLSVEMGYNKFIETARSLLPAKVVKAKGNEQKGKHTELTEKQAESLEGQLIKASPKQLADIIDTAALRVIQTSENPRFAIMSSLVTVNSIATNMLTLKEATEYELEVANNLVTVSQQAIDALLAITKASNEALEVAKTVQKEVTA